MGGGGEGVRKGINGSFILSVFTGYFIFLTLFYFRIYACFLGVEEGRVGGGSIGEGRKAFLCLSIWRVGGVRVGILYIGTYCINFVWYLVPPPLYFSLGTENEVKKTFFFFAFEFV